MGGPLDVTVRGAGLQLHYLDWGGTSTTHIVFVHGFALTAHTFDTVCEDLRDEFRCVAFDLRGHGDSEWSADGAYPTEDYVADLEAVVDALGLQGFVLVGHSLGGMVSVTYAARHQHRLRGLVMVDTGARERLRIGADRIRTFVNGQDVAEFEVFLERAMEFNPRRDRDILRKSLLNNLRQTPDGRWTWKYDRRRLGAPPLTPEEFAQRQEALRVAARSIEVPTLLIHGAESDTYSDEDAKAYAKCFPDGQLVTIQGAGHTVQGDKPHEFAAAVRQFIASLDQHPRARA